MRHSPCPEGLHSSVGEINEQNGNCSKMWKGLPIYSTFIAILKQIVVEAMQVDEVTQLIYWVMKKKRGLKSLS